MVGCQWHGSVLDHHQSAVSIEELWPIAGERWAVSYSSVKMCFVVHVSWDFNAPKCVFAYARLSDLNDLNWCIRLMRNIYNTLNYEFSI